MVGSTKIKKGSSYGTTKAKSVDDSKDSSLTNNPSPILIRKRIINGDIKESSGDASTDQLIAQKGEKKD